MEGDLESFPVLDLLQWLHESHRSVVMRVDANGRSGWIFFNKGKLFRAEWGGTTGRDALAQLVQLQRGSFWLNKYLLTSGRQNVHTPTAELLLELALLKDEVRRTSAA